MHVLCLTFHKKSIEMGPKQVRPSLNILIDVENVNPYQWIPLEKLDIKMYITLDLFYDRPGCRFRR